MDAAITRYSATEAADDAQQELVARKPDQRGMKRNVRLLHPPPLLPRPSRGKSAGNPGQRLEVRARRVLRDHAGGKPLERRPHVVHLGQVPDGRPGQVHALLLPTLDQAIVLQFPESLANGGPADPEPIGELLLRERLLLEGFRHQEQLRDVPGQIGFRLFCMHNTNKRMLYLAGCQERRGSDRAGQGEHEHAGLLTVSNLFLVPLLLLLEPGQVGRGARTGSFPPPRRSPRPSSGGSPHRVPARPSLPCRMRRFRPAAPSAPRCTLCPRPCAPWPVRKHS